MTHLLAVLLHEQNPRWLLLVLLEGLLGGGAAVAVLLWQRPGRQAQAATALLYGAIISLTSWIAFFTALSSTYPRLTLSLPIGWGLAATAMSLGGSIAAGFIQKFGSRSARNAMVAGSLLACGFSCMLFTAMAGLVQPFALAYDLTAVLAVMVIGAALCGYAVWEHGNTRRRQPWIIAACLTALAISVVAFGSLAAILPFEEWVTAVEQTDNLASSPVGIIAVAEFVTMLGLGLSGSLLDNRAAARDQQETNRLRQLADSTMEGILIHRDGAILDSNASLAGLLGITLDELRASDVARFLVPDAASAGWTAEPGTGVQETEILAANGDRIPVEIRSRNIIYHGLPALVTGLRDVRERRASEQRIRFLAHHDMLTSLPNRELLRQSLDHALQTAERSQVKLAVFCLDLDGFKAVNDTHGHAAGDDLLCQVATRLRDNLRETDVVARIGGDEFVVLQTTGAQPEQAVVLAQRLITCIAAPFQLNAEAVNVGTSIGIAIYPNDGETAAELLRCADIALYRAKEAGRGWFSMFERTMESAVRERRAMEQDLRSALQNDAFTLSFQPLFSRKRQLVAFEALLRWTHPTLGPLSPAEFIPLAESCGVIVPLGEWILRTACQAATAWPHPYRVAVNLSPAQFMRGGLADAVATILAETGLPAGRLELEITEGVLMDNNGNAGRTLDELRALGARLVLDDFGTGFASLAYLQRYPFDKLKVDRSFVQRLESEAGSRAIVTAVIAIARALNLETTAEGVETSEQFAFLCAQGCDELQGFLLSHPIPQAAVAAFLRDGFGPDGVLLATESCALTQPARPVLDFASA